MGWNESRVYQSAWPQIEKTAGAIMADPYLMPPCPILYKVFDCLADNNTGGALSRLQDILRAIVLSLHKSVMDGAGDHEISLLAFWKHLITQGANNDYETFVFLPTYGRMRKEYPEGNPNMEIFHIEQPLCIWARTKYFQAAQNLDKSPFPYLDPIKPRRTPYKAPTAQIKGISR